MPLGKIHRWWLREFERCGGRMATGGHGGAYGAAFASLCKRELISLDMSFSSFGVFELTEAGWMVADAVLPANR